MVVVPKEQRFKRSTYETPKEMISQLVQFQKTLLVDEDVDWLFVNISQDHVSRFVQDYFKIFPSCQELPWEDKRVLLWRHFSEVHMLRNASRCDISALSRDACVAMVLEKCESCSPEDASAIGGTAFDLVKKLDDLGLDDEEYALLQALVLFTVCPGLEEPEVVQETQCYVLHALCAHTYEKGHWDRPEHIICAKGILKTLGLEIINTDRVNSLFLKGYKLGSLCVGDLPQAPPSQKALRDAQEELISELLQFQEEHESPSEDDLKDVAAFPLGDSEEDSLKRFQHFAEITILILQLIVEVCKKIPGFHTLPRDDNITQIVHSSSKILILRASRRYDRETDSIVFGDDWFYTREDFHSAGMGDSADHLFRFCRSVPEMDDAEYALLTAVLLFSEWPGLLEPQKVKKAHDFYKETLRAYISDTHRRPRRRFARLLATLSELCTLGAMYEKLCISHKYQNKKLPVFLFEMLDSLSERTA